MSRRKGGGHEGQVLPESGLAQEEPATLPDSAVAGQAEGAATEASANGDMTSARPWYSLMGQERGAPGQVVIQAFGTIGQARKWWQQSSDLATRVFTDISLIRSKLVSMALLTDAPARKPRQRRAKAQ